MSRPFRAGEQVLLIDGKRRLLPRHPGRGVRRSTATPASSPTTSSWAGPREPWCARRWAPGSPPFRPTLADFVLKMPRGAQVIYPKDLGPDPHDRRRLPGRQDPGVRRRLRCAVDDAAAGRSRGRRLRAPGRLRRPGPDQRRSLSSATRRRPGTGSSGATATTGSTRPSSTGYCSTCPSRGRWSSTPSGRCTRAASSSPTRRPSARPTQLREALDDSTFAFASTVEVLQRSWHIEGQSVRPDHRMVAHTGFLTSARLLGWG